MKKLSKGDWLAAGMDALAARGEAALRIDHLCQQLQVSKGSFFHHFKNIEAYMGALMEFWEANNTTGILEEAEKMPFLEQKIARISKLVLPEGQEIEVRIRAWGAKDPRIKKVTDRIDRLRTNYLRELYLQRGLPKEKASDFAKIEYAAFVGMQHLYRDVPPDELQRLHRIFGQLINPDTL